MKQVYSLFLVMTILILCLAGCGRSGDTFSFVSDDTVWGDSESVVSETPRAKKKANKQSEPEISPVPSAEADETVRKNDDVTIVEGPQDGTARMTINTQYYTMTLPDNWVENYTYELDYQPQGGYFLALYELNDHKSFGGGTVVTIGLYPEGEDFSYLPDYSQFGMLTTPDGKFAIVILYPTDFQYTTENAAIYERMAEQIPDVINSMAAAEGCSIQKM